MVVNVHLLRSWGLIACLPDGSQYLTLRFHLKKISWPLGNIPPDLSVQFVSKFFLELGLHCLHFLFVNYPFDTENSTFFCLLM